jgi:hypothetical protein
MKIKILILEFGSTAECSGLTLPCIFLLCKDIFVETRNYGTLYFAFAYIIARVHSTDQQETDQCATHHLDIFLKHALHYQRIFFKHNFAQNSLYSVKIDRLFAFQVTFKEIILLILFLLISRHVALSVKKVFTWIRVQCVLSCAMPQHFIYFANARPLSRGGSPTQPTHRLHQHGEFHE